MATRNYAMTAGGLVINSDTLVTRVSLEAARTGDSWGAGDVVNLAAGTYPTGGLQLFSTGMVLQGAGQGLTVLTHTALPLAICSNKTSVKKLSVQQLTAGTNSCIQISALNAGVTIEAFLVQNVDCFPGGGPGGACGVQYDMANNLLVSGVYDRVRVFGSTGANKSAEAFDNADGSSNPATAAWAGGTATITTTNNHGLVTGQIVTIIQMSRSGYNGRFTITSTGAKTFTYTVADPGGTATGGAVTLINPFSYGSVIRHINCEAYNSRYSTSNPCVSYDTRCRNIWQGGRIQNCATVAMDCIVANGTLNEVDGVTFQDTLQDETATSWAVRAGKVRNCKFINSGGIRLSAPDGYHGLIENCDIARSTSRLLTERAVGIDVRLRYFTIRKTRITGFNVSQLAGHTDQGLRLTDATDNYVGLLDRVYFYNCYNTINSDQFNGFLELRRVTALYDGPSTSSGQGVRMFQLFGESTVITVRMAGCVFSLVPSSVHGLLDAVFSVIDAKTLYDTANSGGNWVYAVNGSGDGTTYPGAGATARDKASTTAADNPLINPVSGRLQPTSPALGWLARTLWSVRKTASGGHVRSGSVGAANLSTAGFDLAANLAGLSAGDLDGGTVVFASNSTTAALQGVAHQINAYTKPGTDHITLTVPLPAAPVNGDTFVILPPMDVPVARLTHYGAATSPTLTNRLTLQAHPYDPLEFASETDAAGDSHDLSFLGTDISAPAGIDAALFRSTPGWLADSPATSDFRRGRSVPAISRGGRLRKLVDVAPEAR